MVVDIHTHAFPDALAPRAIPALAATAQIQAHTDGTCAALRASMRRAGISVAAIMPIATKPSQVRSINAWAAEVNRQGEGLICFGTLHPAQEDWAQEIDRLVESGIPGIKLHADYQDFFVDEPRVLPVYRALAQAGRLVLHHAGRDIGLPPPVHCTPDRLARALDAVPELTVIASHMGGYNQWDLVEKHLLGGDLYFDTAYCLVDLGPERLVGLIRAHGSARVLFGTDSPWTDQAAELEGFRALPLTEEEEKAVLGGNAERLLGLGSAKVAVQSAGSPARQDVCRGHGRWP